MAGISAFAMLITSAAASTALSQSIQNEGAVNQVSKNVSITLETQKDKNVTIKHKLNALHNMVKSREMSSNA